MRYNLVDFNTHHIDMLGNVSHNPHETQMTHTNMFSIYCLKISISFMCVYIYN